MTVVLNWEQLTVPRNISAVLEGRRVLLASKGYYLTSCNTQRTSSHNKNYMLNTSAVLRLTGKPC
jgi:hypothetical protein